MARSLGLGRVRTFWTVTVGQARLAIFGGALLVGLVVLAEFGAFEILGYQTLTTEIYNEFQVGFNEPAACALSVILVLLGALLLASEDSVRGHGRTSRVGAGAARRIRPVPLGRARPAVLAGAVLLVALALGVPVGAIIYLIVQGGNTTLPPASLLHRDREHLRLRRGRRPGRHAGGAPDRLAVGPLRPPPCDRAPEDQHARPGRTGSRRSR